MSSRGGGDENSDLIRRIERAVEREIAQVEPTLRLDELISTYGNEQYQFEQTPANRIQYILKLLDISPEDTVFDLGSGYGDLLLVGSVLYSAGFVGVEVVEQRHRAAIRVRDRLGLRNIKFINAHVADAGLESGNKFYMFSPFFLPTLELVCTRLERISETKPLMIAAASETTYFLRRLKWLEELPKPASGEHRSAFDLTVGLFRSRP